MKNLMYILAGIMFLTLSCSETDNNGAEPFSNTLKQGHWKIGYSTYDGKDQTFAYHDYKITFTDRNTVSASGVSFYRGNWIAQKNGDLLSITMDWGKTFPFTVLNYKWDVISYDDQAVALEYYNSYYGGKDYLIFERWTTTD